MVATNAFGMGIDKSNVSFAIHYNMPKSIEAYYQEASRAGRDGAEADCILLFNSADVQTVRYLINNSADNEELDSCLCGFLQCDADGHGSETAWNHVCLPKDIRRR